MSLDKDALRQAFSQVIDPGTGKSLGELQAVQGVGVDGSRVSVNLRLPYPVADNTALCDAVHDALSQRAPEATLTPEVSWRVPSHAVQASLQPHPAIRNIVAVGSGKGGVGKSTVATNLALALSRAGARVGILDADIYGPSQPRMLGVAGRPESHDGRTMHPLEGFGVELMSIGLLVDEDTPMIMRGPMVSQALQQMLGETDWGAHHDGALDYLIVDLPPGTGDIQLTLVQKVPLAGAVIVTTPQDVALLDARKAAAMFDKVEVPVLGVIENMSVHVCSNCGHAEPLFGSGGGVQMAAALGLPVLGQLPLSLPLREGGDTGEPVVACRPDSPEAILFAETADALARTLAQRPRSRANPFVNISTENK